MIKQALTIPTVHLNGTSKHDLISDLCEAVRALYEAERVLATASPNARDYYVQAEGAFQKAQDEHRSRMERLRAITSELETIAVAIDETNP